MHSVILSFYFFIEAITQRSQAEIWSSYNWYSEPYGTFRSQRLSNLKMDISTFNVLPCNSSCGFLFYESDQTKNIRYYFILGSLQTLIELQFETLRVAGNFGTCLGPLRSQSGTILFRIQYWRPSMGPGWDLQKCGT